MFAQLVRDLIVLAQLGCIRKLCQDFCPVGVQFCVGQADIANHDRIFFNQSVCNLIALAQLTSTVNYDKMFA